MTARAPLGILGGTFDPIHVAHLRLAEELADAFALEQVVFVPAAVPPHRDAPRASAAQRLEMVRLAVAGNPRFAVDDCELKRSGASYTYDTLQQLRALHGDRPLCLILGADAFSALTTWHRWRELFDLAHMAVARRPGFPLEQVAASLPAALRAEYLHRLLPRPSQLALAPAGGVVVHEITGLDISATQIRALCARRGSLRYLLPDAVIAFIEQHRLYR